MNVPMAGLGVVGRTGKWINKKLHELVNIFSESCPVPYNEL